LGSALKIDAVTIVDLWQRSGAWLRRSHRKLATLAVVILAALLGWHVIFGANGMMVYLAKRAEYRRLQSQMQDLQAENQRLQSNIEHLRSDPETIEREARERLRYARPGETVYILPSPSKSSQSPQK
jgi:cell division protein FtsB